MGTRYLFSRRYNKSKNLKSVSLFSRHHKVTTKWNVKGLLFPIRPDL